MKALLCTQHGPPEDLIVDEVATPEPGPGEVRIRVAAAGVNFPDTLIIQDLYQVKPDLPFSPGGEAAGVIDAVGEGVSGYSVGDRVLAIRGYGAFAETMVAEASHVVPVPAAMPLDVAAGFTMTYGTSLHALEQRARLAEGESLLVLGAAGGVGLAAVELGTLMGARVVAAASSPEKLALCREYGAVETIDYSTEDLRAGIRRSLGNAGPDVIYDPVGGSLSEAAFRSIGWNGRHLVIGFASGTIPKLAFNLPLLKQASLVGVFWGAFVARETTVHEANMARLLAWLEAGELRPHISKRFSLEEGGAAIRWMMDRKAMGKVLIEMPDFAELSGD